MRLMTTTHAYSMRAKQNIYHTSYMQKDYAEKWQPETASQAKARDLAKELLQMQQTVFYEDEETPELLFETDEYEEGLGALYESQRDEEAGGDSTPLEDASRRLTRQLVASKSQFEVQLIIGEAHKHLTNLRMVAMSGDEDAIKEANAIIRKLEKLIRRGNRKITDLGNEARLMREQAKAERDERVQRAKEIERDLKRQMIERKNREKKYLEDRDDDDDEGDDIVKAVNPSTRLDAAAEAKIAAMARALAAAEVSVGQSSGVDGMSADASGGSNGTASSAAGGESAAVSGAEGADAGAGSIDISA